MRFFLIYIFLLVLSSCKEIESDTNNKDFYIGDFTKIPDDIDGCSCVFSKDSSNYFEGKYIYVSDFTDNVFLKINDTLMKFNPIENVNSFDYSSKNELFSINAKIDSSINSGEESSFVIGKLFLIYNTNSDTITQSFFGVCGC